MFLVLGVNEDYMNPKKAILITDCPGVTENKRSIKILKDLRQLQVKGWVVGRMDGWTDGRMGNEGTIEW